MNNNGDIITVQEIRLLYQNEFYECSYPDCEKEETKRNKFKQCSRCQAAKYCSKECQTKHWKAEHKSYCRDIKIVDDGIESDNINELESDDNLHRIEKFQEQYGPLVQLFALCTMISYSTKNVNQSQDLLNKTHVPVIILEDLPPSTKSPKLSIEGTSFVGMEQLTDSIKSSYEESRRLHETSTNSGFIVYTCLYYVCPETGTPSHSYFPYFYGEEYVGWGRQNTRSRYFQYMNTINDMAAGKAKELIAAAKRDKN